MLLAQATLQLFGPVLLATAIAVVAVVFGRIVGIHNVSRAMRANANWAPSIDAPTHTHPLNRTRTRTFTELLEPSQADVDLSDLRTSPADSAAMTLRSERIYL